MNIDMENFRVPLADLENSDDTIVHKRRPVSDAEIVTHLDSKLQSELSVDEFTDTEAIELEVDPDNIMTLAELNSHIEEFEDLFNMSSDEFWEKRPLEIIDTMWGMDWFLLLRARKRILSNGQ